MGASQKFTCCLGPLDSDLYMYSNCSGFDVGGDRNNCNCDGTGNDRACSSPRHSVTSNGRDQFRRTVGLDRLQVKESDIPNLPYLQAVVKESYRLHPSAPLSLPRKSKEEVELYIRTQITSQHSTHPRYLCHPSRPQCLQKSGGVQPRTIFC